MPSIGVISVNYMAHQQLCRCLASLKENCRDNLRFIVVDNSPVSEIDAITRAHPEIKAIVPGYNLGFAGGCNQGMAYALSQNLDYVLLLNPDTWTEHDFIHLLLDELAQEESRAMAGPKILRDTANRDVWYGGAEMNWWLGGPSQITDNRHDADGTAQPVPCLSGCAMLIKTSALTVIGMMPEEYFLYYEDTDYVQRFIQAGFGVVYVPGARLMHDVSSTVGFQSKKYVYYFSRNRVWLMRRWAKWYHFLVFMLYNTLVKIPGALIIFGLLRRRPELVIAYCQGYWHGISHNPEKTTKQMTLT
ncbi:MAG: glycosyltransferase family 2 protein [Desulfobulbaceae bacterium]|nr:glycosyltransferase family 2 protein [Desulfobulbaceae bacterium]